MLRSPLIFSKLGPFIFSTDPSPTSFIVNSSQPSREEVSPAGDREEQEPYQSCELLLHQKLHSIRLFFIINFHAPHYKMNTPLDRMQGASST